MSSDPRIFNFVLYGNFTDEAIKLYLEDCEYSTRQMLRDVYRALLTNINSFSNDDYHTNIIKNGIDLFCILCDKINFNREEVDINRKRIKKLREPILAILKENSNSILLDSANQLDEIVLDKNVDADALVKLIITLIDKREDVDIIKKFLNINKESLITKNNELFDYVFFKAMKSLEIESRDIYYYITLLKLLYTSKINKDRYLRFLHNSTSKKNLFTYEIYLIINGVKRGLTTDEILEKYGIITNLPNGPIIKTNGVVEDEKIITIDGNSTFLRDDGISITKDGNKFIVGIYVADAGSAIPKNSYLDVNARNNYKCLYMRGTRTRMFPSKVENALSLNEGKNRNSITLYVVLNDSGEILDYYIKNNTIIVSQNLTYIQTENILDHLYTNGFERRINELFMIAKALESRNHSKEAYWQKKERSKKIERFKKLKSDVIVREFMSLYSLLMAKIANEEKIPFIYRKQDDEYISSIVQELGMYVDDYTKKILDNIYLESVYSTVPSKHAGLGYPYYSHSSDPLRRYPDFYNQYLFHQFYFKNMECDFDEEEFKELVESFNQRSVELSLMKGEFEREARLTKKK